MNEIYLVIDTTNSTGSESIKGIFAEKKEAKLFLADYVLENNNVFSDYIELEKFEVTMPSTPTPVYEK